MKDEIITDYAGCSIFLTTTYDDRIMKWSAVYRIVNDGTIHVGEIGFFDSENAAEAEGRREGKEHIDNLSMRR
jgi:hypothetical protein